MRACVRVSVQGKGGTGWVPWCAVCCAVQEKRMRAGLAGAVQEALKPFIPLHCDAVYLQ